MSSNVTTNLNLHTWLETDVVDFEEMNDNFNKIDAANKDYVVENGTNDFWTYRKWASGRCELYGTSSHQNVTDWQTYGNAVYKYLTSPSYPITVNDPHVLSVTPMVKPNSGEEGYGLYYATVRDGDSDKVSFYLVSAKSDDTFTGLIRYHVTGWWK